MPSQSECENHLSLYRISSVVGDSHKCTIKSVLVPRVVCDCTSAAALTPVYDDCATLVIYTKSTIAAFRNHIGSESDSKSQPCFSLQCSSVGVEN